MDLDWGLGVNLIPREQGWVGVRATVPLSQGKCKIYQSGPQILPKCTRYFYRLQVDIFWIYIKQKLRNMRLLQ